VLVMMMSTDAKEWMVDEPPEHAVSHYFCQHKAEKASILASPAPKSRTPPRFLSVSQGSRTRLRGNGMNIQWLTMQLLTETNQIFMAQIRNHGS
jgi:hypothetical protein